MKRRRAIIVCLIGVIAIVAAGSLTGWLWHARSLAYRRLPYSLDAEPVIAHRIIPAYDFPPPNAPLIDGWPITGGPMPVPQDVAIEIRSVLRSPLSYTLQTGECFVPGFVVSFGRGRSQVDAVICLECGKVVFYRDGQTWGRRLSDDATKQLKPIYRRLFGDGA